MTRGPGSARHASFPDAKPRLHDFSILRLVETLAALPNHRSRVR